MARDYEGNEITQSYAERVLLAHLDESTHANLSGISGRRFTRFTELLVRMAILRTITP